MTSAADAWQDQLRLAEDALVADLRRVWPFDSHEWDAFSGVTFYLRRWRAEWGLTIRCFEPVGPFMVLDEVVAERPLHHRNWQVLREVDEAVASIKFRWSGITGMPWPAE